MQSIWSHEISRIYNFVAQKYSRKLVSNGFKGALKHVYLHISRKCRVAEVYN
jgi:hypothetical protein